MREVGGELGVDGVQKPQEGCILRSMEQSHVVTASEYCRPEQIQLSGSLSLEACANWRISGFLREIGHTGFGAGEDEWLGFSRINGKSGGEGLVLVG